MIKNIQYLYDDIFLAVPIMIFVLGETTLVSEQILNHVDIFYV